MSEVKKEKKKRNMWKLIAIVLMIVLAWSLILKSCGKILYKAQSVPENYTETVKTGGNIEAKYLQHGTHDVEYFEYPAMMSFEKFEIYYPADIASMEKLPIVIFVNGTGTGGSKYTALQKHMAYWGFITVATEEQNAWNGFSAEMSVRVLDLLNTYQEEGKENQFYGKVDMDRIGVTGHSQGGIGVINAITDQRHADSYKAAVLLSSTQTDMSAALLWDNDPSLIHTPILMIGSTGQTDAAITPLEAMEHTYSIIPDGVDKVMARRNDCDHGEMLYFGDGYVTAWFMYYLQGDAEAGKAFFAENAEITSNAKYQDVQINK